MTDEVPSASGSTAQHSTSTQGGAGATAARDIGHFATISVASSTKLPFIDQSAAAVVSSPPYCTRIDYAVTTAPELAVLGFASTDARELRDAMIGTSTITNAAADLDFTWGATCAQLLEDIAVHRSKASSTYYLRTHLQYFDGLARSLRELDRVLRKDAPCALVVQDSYYKEVHNDLPAIVEEMADSIGWTLQNRYDYVSSRHLARVNTRARRYRKASTATESVLLFRSAS